MKKSVYRLIRAILRCNYRGFQTYRYRLSIGAVVDVVYLGGCMDTEIRRVKGEVIERAAGNICTRTQQQHYIFKVLTEEGEVITAHSQWLHQNINLDIWEFRY